MLRCIFGQSRCRCSCRCGFACVTARTRALLLAPGRRRRAAFWPARRTADAVAAARQPLVIVDVVCATTRAEQSRETARTRSSSGSLGVCGCELVLILCFTKLGSGHGFFTLCHAPRAHKRSDTGKRSPIHLLSASRFYCNTAVSINLSPRARC